MAISASDVKKLRDQTGAGMMDCKNALEEANGDFEAAVTILRKKGLASAAKKAGRTTSEGLIGHALSADHGSGTLVEVNCESDFVARTEDFQQLVKDVLAEIEKAGDRATDAWLQDAGGPVQQRVAAAIGKLGENMAVPRFVRYAGPGLRGPVHPHGRQDRRPGGVRRRHARDRRARGVHDARQGNRDADRRGEPAVRVPRRGSLRHARQGARDLSLADAGLRQAGECHRQDRRRQAGELLFAVRPARSAVDSRPEDERSRT